MAEVIDIAADLLFNGWSIVFEPIQQSRADMGMFTASGVQAYAVFSTRVFAERSDGMRIVGFGKSLSSPAGAMISALADVNEKVNAWAKFEIDRFSMRPFQKDNQET